MRWTFCLFLLLLVLLCSFFVSNVEATTETRYMRSDSATVNGLSTYVLGSSQSNTPVQLLLEEALLSSYHVHMGIRVWVRVSGGTETEITSGTAVAIADGTGTGLKSATWSCPEKSLTATDSIVVRVYYSTSSTPNMLVTTFGTEQLGASYLNASTWTVYYYVQRILSGGKKAQAIFYDWYFDFGSSTYDSKVSNFVYTIASSSKTWHSLTWTFDLATRQWSHGYWTFNLNTRQWFHNFWSLELLTRQWNSLSWMWTLITRAWSGQSWTFEIGGKMWNHESWTFDLVTRGWNRQSWTFGLLSKMWNPQYWTFDLLTRGWNQQSWTFDLTTRTWHGQSWMLDLLGRAWSHQFWSFDFIQKEWTHVYRFFNINVRQWNMQNWNFEFAEAFNPGMQGLLLLGILAVIAVIIIAYKHPHIPINL